MAILVILASMVYPSFEAMYDDQKLTDGATKVRAAWAAARSRAINEGRPYRFAAMIGKGNYRVAPESGDFWTGSDPAAPAEGDTPPLVQSETLPKGITFSAQNNGANAPDAGKDTNLPTDSIDGNQWSDNAINVTFLPDGTTRDDVQIVFQMRGARPVVLKLRALTGIVTMKRLDAKDNQP